MKKATGKSLMRMAKPQVLRGKTDKGEMKEFAISIVMERSVESVSGKKVEKFH